jgi:glycosyltransferase involved in cell wall biosynthesis
LTVALTVAAIVSFRLGGSDGVSIEAAKWSSALQHLGFHTLSVAGSGSADLIVSGLGIGATDPLDPLQLADALEPADLVVVENVCSLPLNPAAAVALASLRAGRPTILHHHDLPWQRPQFAHHPPPPTDDAWRHVTINKLSEAELAERHITSTTIYNTFDIDARAGDDARQSTRLALGVDPGVRLVLQPTRAIQRKNVSGGVALAERLGATFWLLGGPEDGFDEQLDSVVSNARCPVILGTPPRVPTSIANCYAACDVVVLPSTWEGFGNPAIESAVHRRALAVGPYPVAKELARHGFKWFQIDNPNPLSEWLDSPDTSLLDTNEAVARRHFNLEDLPRRLGSLIAEMGLVVSSE